jgi:hypothetical protein
MTDSTWETLALPVLEHVAGLEDDDSYHGVLQSEALAEAVGQPLQQVDNELVRLHSASYLSGNLQRVSLGSRLHQLTGPGLTDLGARAVGKWPPNEPYELLLRLVEQRSSTADSTEERSRWLKVRATLADVGKGRGRRAGRGVDEGSHRPERLMDRRRP